MRRKDKQVIRRILYLFIILAVMYLVETADPEGSSFHSLPSISTESEVSSDVNGKKIGDAISWQTASDTGATTIATDGSSIPVPPVSASDIPDYAGNDTYVVNGNTPFFLDQELTTNEFELYSELDSLGRCQTAFANISSYTLPTEKRGEISEVKPTGWHQAAYEEVLQEESSAFLYNRCHLIAYSLAAENANKYNLITGTRHMNMAMTTYENMVGDYVKETGNHVAYRVTPLFDGDDLLAKGVLMEAESVEDKGADILYCVFLYNVQPGVTIDYATGYSSGTEIKN